MPRGSKSMVAARKQRGTLRRFRRVQRPAVRLICLPWAGAGASVYRSMALELPETIDVLAVQLPGRGDRYCEPGLTRMAAVVELVMDELVPLLDRPVVLFGHSMGALVAFEVAQSTRNELGREPELLVASGSGAPGVEENYERCPSDASDEAMVEDIRRLGGTPKELLDDPSMMRALLPALRTDYAVLEDYGQSNRRPLTCPIIACAGDADTSVSRESMSAWRRSTMGAFEEHWLAGDHFYLVADPSELVRRLGQWVVGSVRSLAGVT